MGLWVRSSAIASLCALLYASTAHAQFRSTQWTAEDGLPQNSVRGIAQTSDGYLWIATLNGLARFDGVRFMVFDKSNTPGMSSTRFMAMIRGTSDELWLASEDNNAARFRLGVFEPLGARQGVAPHSVTGLTGNGRGGVWLGSGGRIMRWDASTATFIPETFEVDNARFGALWWRGTGFWSLRGHRLHCFVRGVMRVHALPAAFPLDEIHGVAVGGDNVVWIGLAGDRYARIVDGRVTYASGTVETPFVGRRHTWKAIINSNLDRTLVIPSDGTEKTILYNIISEDNERNTGIRIRGARTVPGPGTIDQGLLDRARPGWQQHLPRAQEPLRRHVDWIVARRTLPCSGGPGRHLHATRRAARAGHGACRRRRRTALGG